MRLAKQTRRLERQPSWRWALKTMYKAFRCRYCGRSYAVVRTIADVHEQDPVCNVCENPGRSEWESDLRLARLLGEERF